MAQNILNEIIIYTFFLKNAKKIPEYYQWDINIENK